MRAFPFLFLFALECQADLLSEYSSLSPYSGLALRTAGIALARLQDQLAAFRTSASRKTFISLPGASSWKNTSVIPDAYLAQAPEQEWI